LVLSFVVVAVGGAVALVKARRKPTKAPESATLVAVEVTPIKVGRRALSMRLQGTVRAARKLVVMPEVGGRIVWHAPQLVVGGLVKKGQPLVRIDARDYQLAARQLAAQVATQKLALDVERARSKVAAREWELFKRDQKELSGSTSNGGTTASPSLALREPHMKSAKVALRSAKSGLAKAKLALSRTVLTAPFNAFVQLENVEIGQLVGPQSQLAGLVGTDTFWVQISIPIDKLGYVQLPSAGKRGSAARVWMTAGRDRIEREGRVLRLLGDLDPVGRMARLLVEVRDPFGTANKQKTASSSALPLLLGSFVQVELEGELVDGVVELPRRALRPGDELFLIDEKDQLVIKKVEVLWGTQHTVLIRGALKSGERLVTSALAVPVAGMKLRVNKPEAAKSAAKPNAPASATAIEKR